MQLASTSVNGPVATISFRAYARLYPHCSPALKLTYQRYSMLFLANIFGKIWGSLHDWSGAERSTARLGLGTAGRRCSGLYTGTSQDHTSSYVQEI